MKRRSFIAMSAIAVAFASVTALSPAQAATTAQAKALVEGVCQQIIDLVKAPGSGPSKAPQLRVILEQNFAVRDVAGFALGRYARGASPAQRDRYVDVYADYVARTYAGKFSEYGGQTISVTNVQDVGRKGIFVNSQVNSNGQFINIGWQVQDDRSGRAKITDINVDGLSMAESQRSEFTRKLAELGGDLDAFTNWLASAV